LTWNKARPCRSFLSTERKILFFLSPWRGEHILYSANMDSTSSIKNCQTGGMRIRTQSMKPWYCLGSRAFLLAYTCSARVSDCLIEPLNHLNIEKQLSHLRLFNNESMTR